jgi:hypothetical protein
VAGRRSKDKGVTLSAVISGERAKSLSVSSPERFFVARPKVGLLRMTSVVPAALVRFFVARPRRGSSE